MTREKALSILGLSRKFTQEEAKLAYRKLARKYHPDVAGEAFNHKFAQINEAYEFISSLGDSVGCVLTHKNIFDVERA
jgi:DnaJ-class molecular chaperone